MNHGASVVRRSHHLLNTQASSRSPPQIIISTTKVFLKSFFFPEPDLDHYVILEFPLCCCGFTTSRSPSAYIQTCLLHQKRAKSSIQDVFSNTSTNRRCWEGSGHEAGESSGDQAEQSHQDYCSKG